MHRSGLGLLFLVAGENDGETTVVVSRFPVVDLLVVGPVPPRILCEGSPGITAALTCPVFLSVFCTGSAEIVTRGNLSLKIWGKMILKITSGHRGKLGASDILVFHCLNPYRMACNTNQQRCWTTWERQNIIVR